MLVYNTMQIRSTMYHAGSCDLIYCVYETLSVSVVSYLEHVARGFPLQNSLLHCSGQGLGVSVGVGVGGVAGSGGRGGERL